MVHRTHQQQSRLHPSDRLFPAKADKPKENGGMTMSMTQEQYNQAHDDAMQVINQYLSGMLLLCELKDRIAAVPAPSLVPHEQVGRLTDPATGLSF